MRETLQDGDISVDVLFDGKAKRAVPQRLDWHGRSYDVSKVGLYHTYRRGRATIHVFSITDGNTFFRLELNSETLCWLLTEVSDGQPD